MNRIIDLERLDKAVKQAVKDSKYIEPNLTSVYVDEDGNLKSTNKNIIIGVCGKSGSGKSTISEILKEKYNGVCLEIDKVGHDVYRHKNVVEELVSSFGKEVVEDGVVNRKKLGNIVFSSKDEMDKLTDITWKYMRMDIDKFIKENEDKVIILDWLLLPNSCYFHKCDIKVLLDIPYEERLKRAIKRDGITKEEFELRDNASIDYDPGDFDIVIKGGNKEEIKKRLYKF